MPKTRKSRVIEITAEPQTDIAAERVIEVEADVSEDTSISVPEVDLEQFTVAQLKDIAGNRGIVVPNNARKADIIELLS